MFQSEKRFRGGKSPTTQYTRSSLHDPDVRSHHLNLLDLGFNKSFRLPRRATLQLRIGAGLLVASAVAAGTGSPAGAIAARLDQAAVATVGVGTPAQAAPPAAGDVPWSQILRQPAAWYGSDAAARVADVVVRHQRHTGGWPKNIDMARPLTDADRARLAADAAGDDSTIDNGATVTELRFLARVVEARGDDRLREVFDRGLTYLLRAQYPNGGWPQYFPVRRDYSAHVTFNDDAMIGVMTLLGDVAGGRAPFTFVRPDRRTRAAAAIDRGLQIVLETQIRVDGRLTGWCQQYDARTLRPAPARAYEHVSISARETAAIASYLTAIEASPAIVAAVDAAAAWLERSALSGIRLERRPDPAAPAGYDVVVVSDATAPPIWARFYDISTNQPIFSGRDGVIRSRLADIEVERRTGYSWLGEYATTFLGRDYPAWKARLRR